MKRKVIVILLSACALGCNKLSDDKEYCFISSTSPYREDEVIVNLEDSVVITRFILKAPYSHYNTLLDDTLSTDKHSVTEKNDPFLMLRFSILDSLKEDLLISGLNLHLFKLYDSIPGDEIGIHGICTKNGDQQIHASEIVGKAFSDKDTLKIKGGAKHPSVFMVTDYDLKDHKDDASFLLRTQMTIKYKNAYNIVDMYDTIVRHDRK